MCALKKKKNKKQKKKKKKKTVECPRGDDVRKYASAEERAAKNQKTTVRHFGFTEKVYGLPCTVRTLLSVWKRHHINAIVGTNMKYLCM